MDEVSCVLNATIVIVFAIVVLVLVLVVYLAEVQPDVKSAAAPGVALRPVGRRAALSGEDV